ncbi:hypothetical protein GMJAKD_09945 [Candidatus Electrothrix aarhusensis]
MYGKILSDDDQKKLLELENDIEAIVFNIKIISQDYDDINERNKGKYLKKEILLLMQLDRLVYN